MVKIPGRHAGKPEASENVERLKKLYELSMTLSGDPAELFGRIANMIGDLLEVPIVCLSEIRGAELHFLAVYNKGTMVPNAGSCPLDITPCATVQQTKDIRVYDRVAERFSKAAFLEQHSAFSYCGFPSLDHDGNVVAVTCLLDDKPHEFTPEDQELLRVFGQRIGMEIERQKYLDERSRVQSALVEAEAKYRRIFENADEGIFQSAPDGRFISANAALADMLGYDSAEDLMTSVQHIGEQLFVDPDERRTCMANLATHGRIRGKEIRWRRKDGQVVWLLESVHEVRGGNGDLLFYEGTVADITERKRAGEALRESQEQLQAIMDNSPITISVKDVEGRYLLTNRQHKNLFGGSLRESTGRCAHDLYPTEHADSLMAHHREVLETGKAIQREETLVLENESHTYLSTRFPIRDATGEIKYVGSIAADITERKQAEEELRESQARLKSITDNLSGGIYRRVLHSDGTVSYPYVSPGIHRIYDIDPDKAALNSQYVFDSLHPDDIGQMLESMRASAETMEPYDCEYRLIGDGGGVTWCRSIATPRRMENGDIVWDGLAVDITERKRAQNAIRAAKEEAEAANRAKSEFLAAMSHELRTPLNAIIGFSEIMKSEQLGPIGSTKYRDYAEDINSSGQLLLALINDILDISKVESGTDELHEETINIPETVRSIISLVRERAAERNIALELELLEPAPGLRVDKRKLKQMLVNLLTNAIKFTNAGGKVTVRTACHPDSGCEFQVIDTGIGIAPENISKALSEFGQVDRNLEHAREGTGLGLPLTKALAEQHGGTLDLQSEAGIGTTVTLRFPPSRVVRLEQGKTSPGQDTRKAG